MAGALDTLMVIIPEIGEERKIFANLALKPSYDSLKRLIEPHLDGERLEHVAVLWEGERRDMFVGECSSINGRMIRNVRATDIYRENARHSFLAEHTSPEGVRSRAFDPESLPAMSGPVVLFPHRRVWF